MARLWISDGNVEQAATYKTLFQGRGQISASGAGTLLGDEGGWVAAANAGAGARVIHIDPADYPAGAKTNYLRCALSILTNDTAPGAGTWTLGLYPVTACAGGATTISVTLGSVVSGSTAVITSPLADTLNFQAGSDFAFPTAGFYALALVIQTSMGANTSFAVRAVLQRRAT